MGNQKLVFKISKSGELEVSGEGFKGGNCLKAAEKYLAALGKVEKQTLKPEFFSGEEAHITITN